MFSPRRLPGLLAALLAPTALLALAACGDLPQPFKGRPGLLASRLAQPPPSRLSVPVPAESLLSDAAAAAWAGAVAEALVAEEIPASPGRRRSDWALVMSAEVHGAQVVPTYTVQNPKGEAQGTSEGSGVPAADWASGSPAVLKAAAVQAAPGIAALLGRIEAARQLSDPNSLMNRPARIYFSGVTGAPGDGNTSLPAVMRSKMAALGLVVQDTITGADFTLRGEVHTAKGAGNTTRIEVQWYVNNADATGAERGRIVQLNEVPPGILDQYWGDVAVAVANDAAGGVRDVILNAGARRPDATKPGAAQPAATQPGAAQPGTAQPGTAQPGATPPAGLRAGTGKADPAAVGSK